MVPTLMLCRSFYDSRILGSISTLAGCWLASSPELSASSETANYLISAFNMSLLLICFSKVGESDDCCRRAEAFFNPELSLDGKP